MSSIYHFLFLFLFLNGLSAQVPITDWSKQFGDTGMNTPNQIIQTDDNGYIFIGTTIGNNADIWVVKLNSNGSKQWSKNYGSADDEFGYAISTTDNGYILAGTKANHIWVIRISLTGTMVWEQSFGNEKDIPSSIFSTDSGFIVGATSFSANKSNGLSDFWVFKLDNQGNLLWEKYYGGSFSEKLSRLIPTLEGGMIAIGSTNSKDGGIVNPKGQSDIVVMKMDAIGNLIWSKNYGGEATDVGSDIFELNNQFILIGTKGILHLDATGIQPTFDKDICVLKISSNGDLLWESLLGGTKYDYGNSIIPTNNGIIVGASSLSYDGDISTSKGGSDAWISKIDNQGNLLWQKSYGGNKDEWVSNIILDRNGGQVVLASTNSKNEDISNNHGNHDAWVYKLAGTISLNVNLGPDKTICAGASTLLQATIPNCTECTYHWSSDETSDKITVNPTSTTTYSVTVTKNGLQATDEIQVIIVSEPSINTTVTDVDCNGSNTGKISIVVNGEHNPFTAHWSYNNQVGTTINNLPKGIYSTTITDDLGCTFEETYMVDQPTLLEDNPMIENICGQNTKGSIHLNPKGGVGNYQFAWNDFSTQKNRTNLNQGNYNVTITDGNSCTLVESFEILQNSISFIPMVQQISCYGKNDGKIDLGLAGNTSDYTIHWDYNNFATPIIEHLPIGNYSVTITNSLGCSSMESFLITQPNQMIVTSVIDDNRCAEEMKGQIDISVLGGTSPYEFDWSNGKHTTKISNLLSSTYKLTVTDNQQCSLTRSYVIKEPKKISIIGATTPLKCANDNSGSIVIIVSGGIPDYQITINDNPSTTGLITGLAANDYLVIAKDQNECEATKTYTVTEPSPLKIDISIKNTSVNNNNGSIQVNPSGGTPDYNILWDDGTKGGTIENIGKGDYHVLVTDANGCQKDTTITIMEVAIKSISASQKINIYPNPTTGKVYIDLDHGKLESITVFSPIGKQIIKKHNILSDFTLNLSDYSNGVYYFLIQTSTETYAEKVVLIRNR